MSFFNKLFGGDDKKPEPKTAKAPPQPQPNDIDAKKIKIEAAVNGLDAKILEFQDKEKKLQNKSDIMKAKATELVQAGKVKEAKKYAEEATKIKKQVENYTLRKKVLVDKKFELEQVSMDMQAIEAIKDASQFSKEQAKYTGQLQDIILDSKEIKMQQMQINDKMKDLVDHDSQDQEVDEMMKEIMMDVKKDNQKKIQQAKNVNVNVPQTQKNTNKSKEEDEIAKMLAELN